MFVNAFMMQDKFHIPLSPAREAFVMRSYCNLIGQYPDNNRRMLKSINSLFGEGREVENNEGLFGRFWPV